MSRNFTSDQELIDRLLLNDTDAFEELYRRYWYSLYSYSLKKLYSSNDARQVVRDIFIELWEKRHTWPVNFSVSQHLYIEVRKSVVTSLSNKLATTDHSEETDNQIMDDFSAQALQHAKLPVSPRRQEYTPTRPLGDTIIEKKGAKYNTLSNVKWLFQLVSAKLN